MGGGSAPAPDPNIGIAALRSAETGQEMLSWMQSQAQITNQWAQQDRDRYQSVFVPAQDRMIAEAETWDSPGRTAARVDQARADVAGAGARAIEQGRRGAAAMGVNPASGRFIAQEGRTRENLALAEAGAANTAKRAVEAEGYTRRANVVNMGAGMGVNPGTAMQISNSAGGAGFQGAMQGYGQQGQLLNTQYQQQIDQWQAKQGALSSLGGAFGTVAGLIWGSSKDIKHDKKPVEDALGAVRSMPVEEWTYNRGEGDGGRHVGPYAEDFAKATGKGDGKTINAIDAIGVTMGAVQELDRKVEALTQALGARPEAMAA